ncbi:unnamed protein product, partial [Closterium sp. NIES-53]
RVLWLWMVLAAAILSLVFATAWQHAQASERDDLEGHCDEWAAFIEAKFNTTAANTRSISDFIRAYYLDNMREDFLDVEKFQRFTQATLDGRPMASFVGFTLLVNNTFIRDIVEKNSNHCIFSPEPNGALACRPRDLPLYSPLVIFNSRNDFNTRVNLSSVCCLDVMADPAFNDTFHRAINAASSAISPPFVRNNYSYHFIGQAFPVYFNLTTFALPPSPFPSPVAIPPLATPEDLPRGFVIAGYNFANLQSLVGFQQLVELNARVYLVDGTRGRAWDGTRSGDGRIVKWLPALLFDHEGVVGEEEIGAWMMDEKGQDDGARVRRAVHLGDPTRRFYLFCEHISYAKPFGPFTWIVVVVLFLTVSTILLWTSIQLMHAFECDCQHLAAAQHELRAARLEAEAASRAKGDFLTTMSHEIRTPMNGVIGMLNLLLETPLDGSQKDYAQTAQSSGRALCALINDILDLSKIEAEKLHLECIPLDLRAELDDVLALFVESAQEKRSVELAAFVADDVPEMLLGDPLRVKQILINLVSNAFKFTTKGHVFIAVRVATTTDSSSGPNLPPPLSPSSSASTQSPSHSPSPSATPSGSPAASPSAAASCTGIPRHARKHLFRPYAQADRSTARLHGGTGIGLSICK